MTDKPSMSPTPKATMGSPSLVAKNEGPKPLAGAGFLDSGKSGWDDLQKAADGHPDWFALSVDGVSFGLDMLALALNPFGEIIKCGVGWLMEHVAFLREPLELLTGDPNAITATSKTWQNIAQQLTTTAGTYEQALGGIGGWKGDTAEKYRKAAGEYVQGLKALAAHADDVAQGVAVAGMVVATVRAIVFDIIADFISRMIVEAIIAAAAAAPSFGGSMAAFFTSMSVDLTVTFANITKRFAKLVQSIKRFIAKFDSLGAGGKKVTQSLNQKGMDINNWADRLVKSKMKDKIRSNIDTKSKSPLWNNKWNKPITTMGDTPQAINDSLGVKGAKESAKSVNDGKDAAGGGSEKTK